jgi:hypothetical protein
VRSLVTFVALALLAVPGTAVALGKGAKVYRATLAPVAVDATTPTGRAHLVDGKRNNILTIHAKGLTAGLTYPWHMHAVAAGVTDPCAPGATPGPVVDSFTYGPLAAGPAGNARAKAKSPSFDWGAATNQYYADIHDPVTDAPIACGLLDRKARTGNRPKKPQPQGKLRGFERR